MQVLVLGGGVAGLAAALAARQAGWRTVVVERRAPDQASTRDGHVHRLAAPVLSRLTQWTDETISAGDAHTAVATVGDLAWDGRQTLTGLGRIEAALAGAAVRAGVQLVFEQSVCALEATKSRWLAKTDTAHQIQADLVIDATGAGRSLFALLGDDGPQVRLDEVGAPERNVSWAGLSAPGDPVLIAWKESAMEGLFQVEPGGRTLLTARSCAAGVLSLDVVTTAMARAGGAELERRVCHAGLSGRGLSHLTQGARRVALEQDDLSRWPPFALVGDALIEAPPRYGEGVGRALDHADWMQTCLADANWRDCGQSLARRSAAHWAGYGVAASLGAA